MDDLHCLESPSERVVLVPVGREHIRLPRTILSNMRLKMYRFSILAIFQSLFPDFSRSQITETSEDGSPKREGQGTII